MQYSHKAAQLDPSGVYRYWLARSWGPVSKDKTVAFIGLNPSTADADVDDPTIRRCVGFAQSFGATQLVMLNVFAYRSTDPKRLRAVTDPVGPDNDVTLAYARENAGMAIAAWGAFPEHKMRFDAVRSMFPELCVLRLTKQGFPSHPLYLPSTLTPIKWNL